MKMKCVMSIGSSSSREQRAGSRLGCTAAASSIAFASCYFHFLAKFSHFSLCLSRQAKFYQHAAEIIEKVQR
jgi:hypothetical protein